MGTERSSSTTPSKAPLHNFTLPGGLRWGNQKFLRCMKVNSNGQNSAIERKPSQFGSSVTNNSYFYNGTENNSVFGNNKNVHSRSENNDDYASYYSNYETNDSKRLKGSEGDGIDAVREKVILDLKNAADKMKDAISRRGSFDDVRAEEGSQPWNFRTRREAYGVVSGGGGSAGGGGAKNLNLDAIKSNAGVLMASPLRMVEGETTQRLRNGGVSVALPAPTSEKKERVKFSATLARREIEEDFIAMVRHRPPRRPRKRPKYIQKQLDTLFPGVWLTEITADMYKVSET